MIETLDPRQDQDTQEERSAKTPLAETSSDTSEQFDDREPSQLGSRIQNAATRISSYLEDRAITSAHGEAMAEDQQRGGELQRDAFASYTDNIDTTKSRERAERIDNAKQTMRNIGIKSLNYLQVGGEIAIGTGLLASEAIAAKAKSAGETVALSTMYAAESVKAKTSDYTEKTKMSVRTLYAEKKVAALASLENRQSARHIRRESKNKVRADNRAYQEAAYANRKAERTAEIQDKKRAKLQKAEAALDTKLKRRQARNDKFNARKNKATEKFTAAANRTSEIWNTAHIKRRAIGAGALRTVNRAHASGKAATQEWKLYKD